MGSNPTLSARNWNYLNKNKDIGFGIPVDVQMEEQIIWCGGAVGKLKDRIATRAYLMGVDGKPGSAEQHWLAAEHVEWMEWLVASRSANQAATLKLYGLIREYKDVIMAYPQSGYIVDSLTGIAFSLWRAVFLGKAQRGLRNMVDHAEGFLENLINTNAVLFANEARTGNWSFRYYTNSAALRLKFISEFPVGPDLLPQYIPFKGDATDWWELNEERFELAIANFEAELLKLKMERA